MLSFPKPFREIPQGTLRPTLRALIQNEEVVERREAPQENTQQPPIP